MRLWLIIVIMASVSAEYLKRDCRANWKWNTYTGLECPNEAVGGQKYHIEDSPSEHKLLDIIIHIKKRPINPYKELNRLRRVAFSSPHTRFIAAIDPGIIPYVMVADWEYGLRKIRDVENVRLVGVVPQNATHFIQDYVKGYRDAWNFHGVLYEGPDYMHYELYKDMNKLWETGIHIFDFAKATYGHHIMDTPHFWYDISDYAINYEGDFEQFKDVEPIEWSYDTRFATYIHGHDKFKEILEITYLKKYEAIMFAEFNLRNLGVIVHWIEHTKNGRKCFSHIRATRPCNSPARTTSELNALGGTIYSPPIPEPDVLTYHSTGFTAVMPIGSQFKNNAFAKNHRRRAFLRNIFDNYDKYSLLVDDSFVYIPAGMSDGAWKIRLTEEETLGLDVIDMGNEAYPIHIPMYEHEIIGLKTDNGEVLIEISDHGAYLDHKNTYNTEWKGTRWHIEDHQEYRFKVNGKPYQMLVSLGIFISNGTSFPRDECLATPYTEAINFNKDTKEEFRNTYKFRGTWVLDEWMIRLLCCLRTDYTHVTGKSTLVDLKIKEHAIQNISDALKLICEERSVFEVAYDKRGPPCQYCMRAREIKARYNGTEMRDNHVIIQFDKPIRAQGSYQYVINHTYENNTYFVDQTFVKHDNELWIPVKTEHCGQDITIDMENVHVKAHFWNTHFWTTRVNNIEYSTTPCHQHLGHVDYIKPKAPDTDGLTDEEIMWILIGSAVVIVLFAVLYINPGRPRPVAVPTRTILYRKLRKPRKGMWREF